MSDDPRQPHEDEPGGPFPESSLGSSGAADQADPPPSADPLTDPPGGPQGPGPDGPPPLGERWAAPERRDPPPGGHELPHPPGPSTPQPRAGYQSGDPLGGSATPGFTHGDPLGRAPSASPPSGGYPGGYTSPPPPGAGGTWPPPAPTPGDGTLVLSGWWRRAGAAIIDGLIIGVAAGAIMAPLGVGLFSTDPQDTGGLFTLMAGFLVGMLVIAVVALLYAPVMMGATNGRTVGRMVTGIRVVRANGQPMTFGFAAIREIAVKVLLINAVAGSFTFGLAGLLDVLWPLWDDENRALHDFVVDTRTVLA